MDLPPDLGNGRMHWRTRHKRKKAYYEACDNRQLLGLIPAPDSVIARCEIAAHFKLHNASDWDNLGARLKFAFDWLVTRGYIADDGPKVILKNPDITQEIDRKNRKLIVTITEV